MSARELILAARLCSLSLSVALALSSCDKKTVKACAYMTDVPAATLVRLEDLSQLAKAIAIALDAKKTLDKYTEIKALTGSFKELPTDDKLVKYLMYDFGKGQIWNFIKDKTVLGEIAETHKSLNGYGGTLKKALESGDAGQIATTAQVGVSALGNLSGYLSWFQGVVKHVDGGSAKTLAKYRAEIGADIRVLRALTAKCGDIQMRCGVGELAGYSCRRGKAGDGCVKNLCDGPKNVMCCPP